MGIMSWFKPAISESNNGKDLIQIMVDQQKANQEMMNRMLSVVEQNSSMMSEWFKLFQPQNGQTKSTTLDEREKIKAGEQEWEQLSHDQLLSLFTQEQVDYEKLMRDS